MNDYYDLAGGRIRYIYSGEYSGPPHTQYRARADITTTDYPTYVGITVTTQFVYAKNTHGPKLTSSGGWFTIQGTSYKGGLSVPTSLNFTTADFGTKQDTTTVTPFSTFSYYVYKSTYAKTETFSVSWDGGISHAENSSASGVVYRQVTNDYSTGTSTTTNCSSGSVYIPIPALASYTLSYDANGGSGAPGAQTLYYDQNFTVSSTQPTRSGYTFRGWTDGSTQYSPGTAYTESKHTNFTLYAIWHKNPTITTKSISTSGPYYKGLTNCSVTYSGASASDGASFSVEIKVGNQFSRTSHASSDTLSVVPQETGNLPVTITIVDSLNASTSYSLSYITVNQYVAPSVVVNAERTNRYGSISNDSNDANAGLITATFTVPSQAGYPMSAPTVTLTRSDGATSTPTVEWYYNRNNDKTVADRFYNWGGITNGTVYGIIKNCNPDYAYQVNITPTDSNNGATKVTKTTIIPPLFYTIDFLAGGDGIAFGAAATKTGFYCKMDTTFGAGIYMELDTGQSNSIDSQLSTAIGNLGWNSGNNPVITN